MRGGAGGRVAARAHACVLLPQGRLEFHAVRLSSSTRLLLLLLRLRFQVDAADAQVIESHLSPQARAARAALVGLSVPV